MSRFLQTVTKSQSVHACAGGELHICHTYAIHISYMFHTYFILEYHNVWYTLTYFFSIVPYSTIFPPSTKQNPEITTTISSSVPPCRTLPILALGHPAVWAPHRCLATAAKALGHVTAPCRAFLRRSGNQGLRCRWPGIPLT